jgi:hypothetical protein
MPAAIAAALKLFIRSMAGLSTAARAQSFAKKLDMSQLVRSDFHGIGFDRRIGEVHLRPTCGCARDRTHIRCVETAAGHRAKIKLRFKVFEIESEIENICV